jgi:NADPH-dependent curcumin reductase CurA
MAMTINRQVRLASRPVGLPTRANWSFTEEPVAEPGNGTFLVKILYISLDPAMRGWLNESRSYIAPVAIGEVMRALAVGRVIASNHPAFAAGHDVSGPFGVQEYALSDGKHVLKVDSDLAPLPVHLSALGMTGRTAYFGLLEVGQLKPGETVVVSAAAGAVGSVVGQIAKIKGCRAVGIAGGPAKCEWVVKELGFDACIDYKAGPVKDGLKAHCPQGVDIYFDNVGGEILDAVLTRLNRHARIIICGAISQYNNTEPVKGPANYLSLLVNRARMQGIVVFDYAERFPQAIAELAGYLKDGRMKGREDVVVGIETFPESLLKLFRGENFGKLVLQVAQG